MTESPSPTREVRGSHRAAGLLTLLEAVAVLGFAGFYVYEMVTGATEDLTRAATSGALILVFGLGLLALARGWSHAADWPRTPTVLWNALLLPVAWSLHESGRTPVALAVGVVAVASIAAAVSAPGRREREPDESGESDASDGRGDVS
ncbi:hypothetical protein [Terrabacter sp. C0L_2]|uniref:hypothetical protein n=1 Tax=Terrabacter sp. C0L_2 TaxID=3108389 RepID=UPI002ED1D74F|nr:hypothetical protein U5C87_20090 [Terrabacter sp. C0L_2]